MVGFTSVSERRSPLLKGVVALAIFSLVFSLFSAFVRPVLANHELADGPEVTPTTEGFPGGEPECPEGSVGVRFTDDEVAADEFKTVTLDDDSEATVTIISVADEELTFKVEGGLASIVKVKGGVAADVDDVNIYDYTGFPGGGIAHDDGLTTPSGQGISHIDFCLVPLPKGSILIYKDDQTLAPVEGAVFSVWNSDLVKVGEITTDADGFGCLPDLPFGDYTVAETSAPDGWTPDPDTKPVTVDEESTCEARLDGPTVEGADATFTNTLLGSLLILKTDEGENPLADAVFTVEGQEGTFTSNADGVFCVDGLVFGETYTVTETDAPDDYVEAAPQDVEVDESDDCATRDQGPDATFVNTLNPLGSITVHKVIACDECETRTRGYYFNTADQHEEETNALFGDGITADGILFTNVDQVQAYLDADISGDSDGENGLSARGQLTVQYLAAELNVLRNGEECDLLSHVYTNADSPFDGWTVGDILAAAEAAFEGDDTYTDQEIQEALNDINNSSESEENPLTCDQGTDGALTDGFTFELFAEADYPDGDATATGTTGDDGTGTLIFSDLELGTYVLVETAPEGMDCAIVEVEGGTLNEDGSVTVTVTEESADVVVTVVNDCGEGEVEAEGSLLISKVDDEGAALPGATFLIDDEEVADADDGADDGFVCIDGLDIDSEVTVSETIAPPGGYVGDDSEHVVTVTNGADCAARMAGDPSTDWDVQFVNTLEEEGGGTLEIDKFFCSTDGESGVDFIVLGPVGEEPLGATQNAEQDLEGCELGAGVAFTIENNETGEITNVVTDENGIVEVTLDPGDYTITEDLSGESTTFTIADNQTTAVVVINLIGEDEGVIKVIKLFCEAEGDSVTFTVEGGNQLPPSLDNCEAGEATFTLNDGDEFTVDGIRLIPVSVGSYVLAEVDPNTGTSESFEVTAGETTTVIVVNNEGGEGEVDAGGGTSGGDEDVSDTAQPSSASSIPAVIWALVLLAALGGLGTWSRAEARRRR